MESLLLLFNKIKIPVLLITLFVTGVFVIAFLYFYSPRQAPRQYTEPPIIEPTIFLPTPITTNQYLESYTQVSIGDIFNESSTLVKEAKKKTILDENTIEYAYASPVDSRDNTITTQYNFVVHKRVVTVDPTTYVHPKLSDYISLYGNPDEEFIGTKEYGRFTKTYIYNSLGFALVGNIYTEEIYEIHVFTQSAKKFVIQEIGIKPDAEGEFK